MGDRALLREVLARRPSLVGFTLYSWNSERSAWLAGRLKEEDPQLVVVGGGPEVYPENGWLMEEPGFDLLVSGEAEGLAHRVLDPECAAELARTHRPLQAPLSTSPPGSRPDPYLEGYLDAGPADSIYLETVRGCAGTCIFCSYRRSHPRPRIMPAKQALDRIAELPGGEITFLDPTFNTRPDLPELLRGLAGMDRSLFAEVRGEPVDRAAAGAMAEAGFASVEVGLQSTNPEVCRRSGRGGDPDAAMRGAGLLRDTGVVPVVDLVMGLPGDSPRTSLRSAAELCDRHLGADVQVFPLAVLPGTEVRRRATELGITHMHRPPYLVLSTPGYPSAESIAGTRNRAGELLGYDLHVNTRPVLTDHWPGTERVRAEDPPPRTPPPSRRHGRLFVEGDELWAEREHLVGHVRRRLAADPFCVLDLVLVPGAPFPLDLLDLLEGMEPVEDYTERMARYLGTRGRLRVSVLVEKPGAVPAGWLTAAAECVPVAVDADGPRALPSRLLRAEVGVRLPGRWKIGPLARRVVVPDRVFFRDSAMEAAWSGEVLGLS
jgi:hypothetical protein